ncbi:MAG: hypothetical protein GY733_17265 [bacterium]|nr:hypothetical protein [bacterium]
MSDERKRSWKEIDQKRDGTHRSEHDRPRHPAAEQRSAVATKSYLKEIDKLFTSTGMSAEAEALLKRVRDAHGSSDLAEACRAFREELGMPRELDLLSIFLDSGEAEIVVEALETLLALVEHADVELGKGVQSQLRILAQDFNNDIAEVAEDILEKLG